MPTLSRCVRGIVVVTALLGSGAVFAQLNTPDRRGINALKLERGLRFDLVLPDRSPERLEIDIPFGSQFWRVRLERTSIFASGAMIEVVGDGGARQYLDPGSIPVYRGVITGDSDSVVAARLTRLGIEMMIVRGDGKTVFVQPTGVGARHVMYEREDVRSIDGLCGSDDFVVQAGRTLLRAQTAMPAASIRIAELAIDADYEYFQLNGSSVTAVAEDVASLMNMVNVVYERDAMVTHVISALIVRTSDNDPYTSTSAVTRLDEFIAHWRENETSVPRDIAHLFTGVDLDGSIVGRAWIGVVCNESLGYGLSQALVRTNLAIRIGLISHELGHNWSAVHCTNDPACQIMCSALGGCDGLGEPDFVSSSADSIMNHADKAGCLDFEVAACAGDTNADSIINFDDITTVLTNWQVDYGFATGPGDADRDGLVDFDDITMVLAHWAEPCG